VRCSTTRTQRAVALLALVAAAEEGSDTLSSGSGSKSEGEGEEPGPAHLDFAGAQQALLQLAACVVGIFLETDEVAVAGVQDRLDRTAVCALLRRRQSNIRMFSRPTPGNSSRQGQGPVIYY
jgi:hypothetical protein